MGQLIHLNIQGMEREAEDVIRRHVGFAMAGGAVPVPLLDLTLVSAVQLDMLKQLAQVYKAPFDPQSARAFVTSVTGALAGNVLARLGASLIKFVPGVGWAAGGVAQVVVTGASTYAVGQLFKRLFRERQSLEDLSLDKVRDELQGYFQSGRELAASWWEARESGGPADDALEALEHLRRLHQSQQVSPEQVAHRQAKVLEHVEGLLRGPDRVEPANAHKLLQRIGELASAGVIAAGDRERLETLWRSRDQEDLP